MDHLITLWKITARSGLVVRVCNYESDLTFEGEVYTAVSLDPTEVQQASGLSPDNAEITIPLAAPFTSTNLLGGFWRGAKVVMQVVDFTALDDPAVSKHVGYLGEIGVNDFAATPEYRSQSQLLNQVIGDQYSETCRVKRFGDSLCKAPLEPYTHAATVTAVTDEQRFTVSGTYTNNILHKGWIVFDSGENEGLEEEIWANDDGDLTLFKPMIGAVEVGDAVTIVEGCDRSKERCMQIVNLANPSGTNIENMRAEPYLPGRTKVFTFPS